MRNYKKEASRSRQKGDEEYLIGGDDENKIRCELQSKSGMY